ncbi:MAG: methylmalonyl-CoA mutase family protein, partial [Acidimicrobiia bacterium]
PEWNMISVSGYHIREAGATAAQEVAFTLANGLAYVEAARDAGLDVDRFAPRISFFWNAHNHLFEEVAKFRAARRMWATLMRDRVGAKDPASWKMRFHTQTAGSTLTAQQPENNIVRTTVQALAGVLGGTQSLHTNAFDEALGLPTAVSATVALRTQQILAFESGVTDTVDPLAGSYYVESMTDAVEAAAIRLMERIDDLGGAVRAIEEGFLQREIEESAYRYALELERGDRTVVGVNEFVVEDEEPAAVMPVDPLLEEAQRSRLSELRSRRDEAAVGEALGALSRTASSEGNVLYPMKDALAAFATVGEVSDVLRDVFGTYR